MVVNKETNEAERFICIDKGAYYIYIRDKDKKEFSCKEFHDLFAEDANFYSDY